MTLPQIQSVIEQHAELLASLWGVRNGVAVSSDAKLSDLARHDQRLAAQADGCLIAGMTGLRAVTAQLAELSAARLFAAAVVALDLQNEKIFDRCVAIALAVPAVCDGLTGAAGWVEPARLRGVAKALLTADSPIERAIGIAACRLHRVHPGAALATAFRDSSPALRAEAWRAVGELGAVADAPNWAMAEEDPMCRLQAARAAVLLGDRSSALDVLIHAGMDSSEGLPEETWQMALQAMPVHTAHEHLRILATDTGRLRDLTEAAGLAGDVGYISWLVDRMYDEPIARLAGDAFSLITGADIRLDRLNRARPDDLDTGPDADPDNTNVKSDPDDGLPWPDVKKVEAWWHANQDRFQKGLRYFMGQPVTKDHCIHVLNAGHQRQRILAAQYLCLLEPGTPLFNTSAPARRQQRLLASM